MDFKKTCAAFLLGCAIILNSFLSGISYCNDDGDAQRNGSSAAIPGGGTEFLDTFFDKLDDIKAVNIASNFKIQEVIDLNGRSTTTTKSGVKSPFYKLKCRNPGEEVMRWQNTEDAPDFSANAGDFSDISGEAPPLDFTSVVKDKMVAWNFLANGTKNKNREDLEKAADLYEKLVLSSSRKDGKFLYFLARCFEELGYIAEGADKTKKLAAANKLFKESAERLKVSPDKTKCVSYKDAVDKVDMVVPGSFDSNTADFVGFGGLIPVSAPVTSEFGMRRHPVRRIQKMHKGIDFGCPRGTKLKAIGDGRVVQACWVSGYGNTNVIEHVVGGKKYFTRYAHLKTTAPVGTLVKRGHDVKGMISGNTGVGTGPHLHFEVRIGYQLGEAVNPRRYFGVLAR